MAHELTAILHDGHDSQITVVRNESGKLYTNLMAALYETPGEELTATEDARVFKSPHTGELITVVS